MAWPTTAVLGVLVEMQLSTGEWVDITSYVYGQPGSEQVTVQRGRTGEAFAVEPAQALFKLENTDGRFSYRNPRSPYFGLINRNTPVRVCVKPHLTDTTTGMADLADTFSRTVALGDSWGTADTGQTWTKSLATAANKLSVSSGSGRLLVSAANTTVRAVLDSTSWYDIDMYATFTTPVATGANLAPYIVTIRRDVTGGNAGIFQVTTTTAGAVQLTLFANSASALGAQIGASATVSGLTHTGQALRTRLRTAGNVFMAKCWDPAATSEPAAWAIIRSDLFSTVGSGGGSMTDPGTVAIACTAPTGNTNVPFTAQYDDVAVTAIEPRACVELTSLPVRWGKGAPTAGPVWVPVAGHGILSRLQNTTEQGRSALWRFIEANQTGLIGYWTLGEGEPAGVAQAEFQRPVLGTLASQSVASGGAAVMLAVGSHATLAGWLEPGVQYAASGGFLQLDRVNGPSNAGAGWSLDFLRAGGQNSSAGTQETVLVNTNLNGAAPSTWQLNFQDSGTSTNMVITDPNGATHSASLSASGVYDGAVHCIRFTTAKSGANITYAFYVDGTSILSGSVVAPDSGGAGMLLTPVFQVGGVQTVTYGHVAVWDTSAPTATACADAALGYAGETVSARLTRISNEADIPHLISTNAGEVLGAQPIGTTYEVMVAAAAGDQGVLLELKDANGILYYTRTSLYSQSDTALTYTTDGHLQEPPEPTDDVLNAVNISTVTRTFASSKTAEITTGILGSANPPTGIGRKAYDPTLNLDDDDRTLRFAEWITALGTVDDSRWPVLQVGLHHMAAHGLQGVLADVIRTDAGYRVTVAGPPTFLPPGTVDQLTLGYTETIDQYLWTVALNCGPFAGYKVGIWNGSPGEFAGRWDVSDSTLAADATSSATSLSVASPTTLWTTTAGDFPFDVNISGVRITVTNITGGGSPQTFTVTRSVDGFDLALATGASVRLWRPSRWGL